MNFVPPRFPRSDHGTETDSIDLAHLWRSKIVEKCALAERHVLRLLCEAGGTCSAKAPLSQKMEQLRKLLPTGKGAIGTNKVGPLLDKLQPLSELRSDLVHSTMTAAFIEGSMVVVLWSAAEPQPAYGSRKLVTVESLKQAYGELSTVANALIQVADRPKKPGSGGCANPRLNPPSPPPPKPAEAAGP